MRGFIALILVTMSCVAAVVETAPQARDKNGQTRVETVDKGRRRVVTADASGRVIEVAEQVEERELPKPVADAFRSHRRAIFVRAMKVTRGGAVTYHVTVRGSRRTAMIAKPDGTVLSFE
jgi:hypothetical protein